MFDRIFVPNLYGSVGDSLSQFARRFGDATVICPTTVETIKVEGQTLLVSDCLPRRTDVHVLLPHGATRLNMIRATDRKTVERVVILVPFGSGESGIQAMRLAVQVANYFGHSRDLRVEILFYHTTWRKSGSKDGWKHLDDDAHEVADDLRLMAQTNSLLFRYQIDIAAPTVPEGIISCALCNHASPIVMARGGEVRIGSYVDQLAAISPVPLLIARKEVAS